MNFQYYAMEKFALDVTFNVFLLYILQTKILTYLEIAIVIYIILNSLVFCILIYGLLKEWSGTTQMMYTTLQIALGSVSIFSISHKSIWYSWQGVYFSIHSIVSILKTFYVCCKVPIEHEHVPLDTFSEL